MKWGQLKSFLETIGSLVTLVGRKHLWVKGMQIYLKWRSNISLRGDNNEKLNNIGDISLFYYSLPQNQLHSSMVINVHKWKQFKFVLLNDHTPSPKEDNNWKKNSKYKIDHILGGKMCIQWFILHFLWTKMMVYLIKRFYPILFIIEKWSSGEQYGPWATCMYFALLKSPCLNTSTP